MTEDLQTAIELRFERIEESEIECEYKGENCHGENLQQRCELEYIDYEDETMQQEYGVEEPV